MGHFVTDEVDRIDLGGGFWVDIKKRMSYGDQQRLMAHFVKLKNLEAPDIDLESGNIALLIINIKAWNLIDNDGNKVELSQKAIEALEPSFAEQIAAEINDRNQPPKVLLSTRKFGQHSRVERPMAKLPENT